MTAPEIESLEGIIPSEPITESGPTKDSAPKRGPGRPKGSRNKPKLTLFGSSNVSSDAASTTTRSRRPTRTGTRAQIRDLCNSIVAGGNLVINFVSKPDTLDEREMTLLVEAIEQEAMTSDRIMRWLAASSPITAHMALLNAAVIIAIPRLQRRGILPRPAYPPEVVSYIASAIGHTPTREEIDGYIREHPSEFGIPTGETAHTPDIASAPVSMEAGTASSTNW